MWGELKRRRIKFSPEYLHRQVGLFGHTYASSAPLFQVLTSVTTTVKKIRDAKVLNAFQGMEITQTLYMLILTFFCARYPPPLAAQKKKLEPPYKWTSPISGPGPSGGGGAARGTTRDGFKTV